MVGLANYADACETFLVELLSTLSVDEVEDLRVDCIELGRRAWINWELANRKDVAAFVGATPSARLKKKRWQLPGVRARLVLAAYYYVWHAWRVLDAQSDIPLIPGNSSRDMAVLAGEVHHRIHFRYEFPEWPFDDRNPFVAGS